MSSIDWVAASVPVKGGRLVAGQIGGLRGTFIEYVPDDGRGGWLYRAGANRPGLFRRLKEVLGK